MFLCICVKLQVLILYNSITLLLLGIRHLIIGYFAVSRGRGIVVEQQTEAVKKRSMKKLSAGSACVNQPALHVATP